MLNVNSYNVKYRVFVCVAHKLIPFHKTRRSQSPPGGPIPCWHIVAWFGTTAYPLSLSYDRANPGRFPLPYRASSRTVRDNGLSAVPCIRPLPCLALPRPALPRPAQPWMLPHPSRQRHALAVGYENCCLEFCCGLVSEPMLPPSRLSAPLLGPPSLRGLSPHHPISCRRVLPAPKGLRLPCSYLLGLPPSGSSFQRAVAAPLAFPVRCEVTIPTGKK